VVDPAFVLSSADNCLELHNTHRVAYVGV